MPVPSLSLSLSPFPPNTHTHPHHTTPHHTTPHHTTRAHLAALYSSRWRVKATSGSYTTTYPGAASHSAITSCASSATNRTPSSRGWCCACWHGPASPPGCRAAAPSVAAAPRGLASASASASSAAAAWPRAGAGGGDSRWPRPEVEATARAAAAAAASWPLPPLRPRPRPPRPPPLQAGQTGSGGPACCNRRHGWRQWAGGQQGAVRSPAATASSRRRCRHPARQ